MTFNSLLSAPPPPRGPQFIVNLFPQFRARCKETRQKVPDAILTTSALSSAIVTSGGHKMEVDITVYSRTSDITSVYTPTQSAESLS